MRVTIVGQKWLGERVLALCLDRGDEVVRVVAPSAEDRAARLAASQGIAVAVLGARRRVESGDVPHSDLIIAAHAHTVIAGAALAKASFGGIGYHPSLLPLYRGKDAVEQAVRAGDRVTGGTVYHLNAVLDGGPVARQDWCFIHAGETAEQLWRRALAPMGVELLSEVLGHLDAFGFIPAEEQESVALFSLREAV